MVRLPPKVCTPLSVRIPDPVFSKRAVVPLYTPEKVVLRLLLPVLRIWAPPEAAMLPEPLSPPTAKVRAVACVIARVPDMVIAPEVEKLAAVL